MYFCRVKLRFYIVRFLYRILNYLSHRLMYASFEKWDAYHFKEYIYLSR